jgi:hypothetical protein
VFTAYCQSMSCSVANSRAPNVPRPALLITTSILPNAAMA